MTYLCVREVQLFRPRCYTRIYTIGQSIWVRFVVIVCKKGLDVNIFCYQNCSKIVHDEIIYHSNDVLFLSHLFLQVQSHEPLQPTSDEQQV